MATLRHDEVAHFFDRIWVHIARRDGVCGFGFAGFPGEFDAIPSSTNADLGTTWQAPNFDDDGWAAGILGIGYGIVSGADPQDFGTDSGLQMRTINASVYVRVPFEVADASNVMSLELSMRFDDGFIAELNDVQVASFNAPSLVEWNSQATANAIEFGDRSVFDLSSQIGGLVDGTNYLTFHGMNASANSSDFLLSPILSAEVVPEPSVRLLTVVGFVSLLVRRRR